MTGVKIQYASGREFLPFSSGNVVVSSGGSLTSAVAGTYYFVIQAENRVGLTLQSTIVSATVVAGQQITITIPAIARETGEEWHNFIVSASTSSTPSTFRQIAKYRGFTAPGVESTLPANIVISRDEHLKIAPSVANAAALPSSTDLLDGMIRVVSDLSSYFYYDQYSTATVNETTVLSAAIGRWLFIGSPYTYIASFSGTGGAGQSIPEIDPETVKHPTYIANGAAGEPVGFWISNESVSPISAGTRLGLTIEFNEEAATNTFSRLLRIRPVGYVNRTTGVLRTVDGALNPLPGVGTEYVFHPRKTNLILPDTLATNESYYLEIYPAFKPENLQGRVPNNTTLKIYPSLYPQTGEYNEAGGLFGDCILAEHDLGRVVPGNGLTVTALKRSGIVDSYSFYGVDSQLVSGLLANTANQIIAINGNGSCFVDASIQTGESQRALVSTLAGTSSPSAYSSSGSVLSGGTLSVTCNYPSTSAGIGTVRSDYPDVLAGNNKGRFNPTQVKVYVKRLSDSVIKEYTFAVVADASQVFNITSWSAGTTVGSLPSPAFNFSLFKPGACTFSSASGSSDFTAGSYQVAFAFHYIGNNVTAISHAEADGCIHEVSYTLAEISQAAKYWASAVISLTELRTVSLSKISDLQVRSVKTPAKLYQYRSDSLAVDDGTSTSAAVKPNSLLITDPGRWVVYNQNIVIGSVRAGWSEDEASVVVTEVSGVQQLDFVLPRGFRGALGPTPSIQIGTVTAGWRGQASVVTRKSGDTVILDFVLPEGQPGSKGENGLKGDQGLTGDPMDPVQFVQYLLYYG